MTEVASSAREDHALNLDLERERGGIAIALAAAAGCVDAVGYFVLDHVFTAHMSGNSVAFGAELGRGAWPEVLRRGFPVPLFVLGVAAGGGFIEAGLRRGHRHTMSMVLTMEAALLVAFMLGGRAALHPGLVPTSDDVAFYALVAVVTVAMGLQTAALQRVGGRVVRTTYVTGMLTRFAEETVVFGFWLRDERRIEGTRRATDWVRHIRRQQPFNRAALLAAIFSTYVAGAVTGGVLSERTGTWAVAPALVVICSVIALDHRAAVHHPADLDAAIGA